MFLGKKINIPTNKQTNKPTQNQQTIQEQRTEWDPDITCNLFE